MSRTKLVILGLVAAFAVSAVASATASAHAFTVCKEVGVNNGKYKDNRCQEEGGEKNWEYKTIGAAEKIKVEGTSGSSQLEGEVGGLQATIECTKDVFTGEILAEGKSTGEITFSGCSFYQINNKNKHRELVSSCTVANINFKFRDQLIDGAGHGPEEEFKPEAEASTLFVEFEIGGSLCAVKAKYKAEVTAANKGVFCAIHEPFRSEVTHEIICTAVGDENLRFNNKRASFYSTDSIQVVGGPQWYAE